MNATLDLALLSTFVAVADAASFSRAAKTLNTTTATTSRAVARLEHVLGSRLFHRTTRQVALTTAGAALYERTVEHVRALRQAAQALPEQQQEPAGTIKLTAPYDLGATILGGVLARFTARFPQVHVHAEFSSGAVDLAAGGFDVAIRGAAGKLTDPSWISRRLVRGTELHFYASPAYVARRGAPRTVGAAEHEWLIAAPFRRLLALPAALEPRIVANDFLFLREVARAGGGVAMLPSVIAEPEVATGQLVRVLSQVRLPVGGLLLLHAATRPLPRKVAAFRDFVMTAFAQEWPE